MNLGETIKSLRIKKGIKQNLLAEKCGLSANALCSIEKNNAFPSKETIKAICDAFRAFKSIKKENGSITQIKVVALLCYPSKFTVEVTVQNFRSGLNGLTDHVEVKKTVRSVEDLREIEIDVPLVESAANYFFES